MKVIVTFGELLDAGVWSDYCDMKGLNHWAINEGLAETDEEAELTKEEAEKLGFLHKEQKEW